MLPTLSTLITRLALDSPAGRASLDMNPSAQALSDARWGCVADVLAGLTGRALLAAQEANLAQRAAQGLSGGDSL